MPELRWTLESTYSDTEHNFRAVGPGVYDVPEDRVEKYLSHRSGGWERVETADGDAGAEDVGDAEDDAEADLIDPAEYTIADLESELESIDDAETLETVRELEQDGKDRAGAVGAIDDRLDAVREG